MKLAIRIVLFVFLIVIQLSLLPRTPLGNWTPNILLCFVILISLFHGAEWGCVTGLIMGLISDTHASLLMGAHAFSYVQIAMIISVFADRILYDNPGVQMMVVAAGCFFSGVLHALFQLLTSHPYSFWDHGSLIVSQTLVTTVITLPMVGLLNRLGIVSLVRHD